MKKTNVLRLTQLALLAAIIALMTFTPIGYLQITPTLEITFMAIPVVLGGIILGPSGGAILGAVFGATSFMQCFGIIRPSAFGAILLGINPYLTFITCMVPRILIGLFAGLIWKAFCKAKNDSNGSVAGLIVSSLVGTLTNTVLFIGMLMIFFGQTEVIRGLEENTIKIIMALAGLNAPIETVV